MTDRNIIIGRLINVTGMIGVVAGLVLFTSGSYCFYFVALVLILQACFIRAPILINRHTWSAFGETRHC